MNLTVPEPPAPNNELITRAKIENEIVPGPKPEPEHPANSTEKPSWARYMLMDDVEVRSCERERMRAKIPNSNFTQNTPPTHLTHLAPIRQDGSHLNLNLPEVLSNFPDTVTLTSSEIESTAASDNELSESNAMFTRWNLLCLSIALTTAGLVTTTLVSNNARSCLCFCLERLSRAHCWIRTRMKKKARQFEKSRESREWSLICYIEEIFLALISFWSLAIAIL